MHQHGTLEKVAEVLQPEHAVVVLAVEIAEF